MCVNCKKKKGHVLFIDIGTNGEIVLTSNGRILCCSCAAGPALEGMNISAGHAGGAGRHRGCEDHRRGCEDPGDRRPGGRQAGAGRASAEAGSWQW